MADNFKQLSSHRYICWTQAGFKQACKAVKGRLDTEERIEGYPRFYPCVVVFSDGYRGYHYINASCTPLKEEIEHAQAYHQRLLDAEAEHAKQLEASHDSTH